MPSVAAAALLSDADRPEHGADGRLPGQVAEFLGRRWLAYDLSREYLAASAFRFLEDTTDAEIKSAFDRIMAGNSIALRPSK